MSRIAPLVTLAFVLVASPALADRDTPYWSCPPEAKDGKLDAKVAWVKKVGCDASINAASSCSDGASTAIALTNTAVEVCRATFAKDADAVKEHDAFAKRCEAKLGNRTKKKLDNELDVATCSLKAAMLLQMLNVPPR